MAEPMMKFDPAGRAPILSYNVPEPTSYSGRNGIALELEGNPDEWFNEGALQPPEGRVPIDNLKNTTADDVTTALRTGNAGIFPNIKTPAATHAGLFYAQSAVRGSDGVLDTASTSVLARGLRKEVVQPNLQILTDPTAMPDEGVQRIAGAGAGPHTSLPPAVRGSVLTGSALADQGVRPHVTELDVEHVVEQLRAGKRLNVYRNLWGEYVHNFLPEPPQARPQILLIETYRLSSFLGQYGAGRTLKTFTLLPGEKTTISVKTFRKSESDQKSASSVLDSFTKESSDDFETSLQQEHSDKQASQESFEYHAEAEASASWGWGSAKVSGGVKGGSASQREEFAKNVSSAVNKHAAKASSKRDVQVDTSSEVREESGEETSITRELQNINVGRVLNFVFRQMNQEHITILHLVDVRVAFWNGYAESVDEVPLPKLDTLLEKYVIEDHRAQLRDLIVGQLSTIFDYKDDLVDPPFVEEKTVGPGDTYLRVRKGLTSTYEDETGNSISVPGVILAVDKIVMRTDGIIVDALLGQGNALDDYAKGLQTSAVSQRELQNDERRARLDGENLARQIVAAKDEDKAEIYQRVFPNAIALPGKISVSASDDGVSVSETMDQPSGND